MLQRAKLLSFVINDHKNVANSEVSMLLQYLFPPFCAPAPIDEGGIRIKGKCRLSGGELSFYSPLTPLPAPALLYLLYLYFAFTVTSGKRRGGGDLVHSHDSMLYCTYLF
jgi:hypothetical protein